jgi:glucokinase
VRSALEAGEKSSLTESLARGEEPGLRELFEAGAAGDRLGRRLAERLTSDLGVLIANLIYALDPELVLVGGGLVNHRPGVLDAVRREVAGRIDFLPPGATEILPMALADTAGVLGGVALAMDAITQTKRGLRAQGEKK